LVIPKPQHAEALRLKPSGAPRIMVWRDAFGMLNAVEFDHQLAREADKVNYVRTNGRLAAKLITAELLRT